MRRLAVLRFPLVAAVFAIAELAGPRTVCAAPPQNDDFANATTIATLPFTESGDLEEATTEGGEPQFCNFQPQTVWYAFTPSSRTVVRGDLNGSDFGVTFNVYQSFGPGFDGLGFLGCTFGERWSSPPRPTRRTTSRAGSISVGPAHLELNLQRVPPPVNDNFANATPIGSRPFIDNVNLTTATTEVGEPVVPSGVFTPICRKCLVHLHSGSKGAAFGDRRLLLRNADSRGLYGSVADEPHRGCRSFRAALELPGNGRHDVPLPARPRRDFRRHRSDDVPPRAHAPARGQLRLLPTHRPTRRFSSSTSPSIPPRSASRRRSGSLAMGRTARAAVRAIGMRPTPTTRPPLRSRPSTVAPPRLPRWSRSGPTT